MRSGSCTVVSNNFYVGACLNVNVYRSPPIASESQSAEDAVPGRKWITQYV